MPSPSLTRQDARAFNQPLNFDTSKVTTMYSMFYVRSARARAHRPYRLTPPPRVACAAQPTRVPALCPPVCLPARTSRCIVYTLSFIDSAYAPRVAGLTALTVSNPTRTSLAPRNHVPRVPACLPALASRPAHLVCPLLH